MTRDKILNTTVEFIRASERRLELAFHVEKALPEVRTELIKEFLECVEKQLINELKAAKGWEIGATGTEGLWIHKESWSQLKVREHSEDEWRGIMLYEEDGDYPYISVISIKGTSKKVQEQIKKQFRNCTGREPVIEGQEIWVRLNDDIEYFKSFDFLKGMIDEKEQGKIVGDMTKKLAELARAVDRVLSNTA